MRNFSAMFLLLALLPYHSYAKDKFLANKPVQLTSDRRRWAEKTLKHLSLEEKVGQMIQVRYYMDFQNFQSDAYKQFRDQLRKYHLGSVTLTVHVDGQLLEKDLPLEVAAVTNQLQRDSKLPLLFSADFERGLASRLEAVPVFPDAMAFGATGNTSYAERFGAISGAESRAIGIHWNLFPVADVNSNPANPIINTRSFGENPEQVAWLVTAYIKGAHANGMLTAAKHFPGHGDTGTDSHLGVARVEGDLERLRTVELPPFEKAIDAGVDSVLIAHVAVPAVEPDPNKVATISRKIVNDLLKGQLRFRGVVMTDALEMRGMTSIYPTGGSPTAQAALDAVKAGNDVVLWPTDLNGAFNAIVDAVKRGELPESQIDDSVRKILELKASLGLHKARSVDLQKVSYAVSKPGDMQFAQQVADDAVTLVRNNGHVLPLPKYEAPAAEAEIFQPNVRPSGKVLVVVITDDLQAPWGRAFASAFKTRRADATFFAIDEAIADALKAQILAAANKAETIVVAAYIVPTAAKQVMVNGKLENSIGLQQGTGNVLQQLLNQAAAKTVLVALGNPYVAQSFPSVETYVCTYSNASSSEVSAVKALFGELLSHGKSPVTLPGIAQRGYSLPWPTTRPAASEPAGR